MKDTLVALSHILHEMQNERGAATLFVGSEGSLYADTINQKFLESDYSIKVLSSAMPGHRKNLTLDPEVMGKVDELLQTLGQFSELRDRILAQDITTSQIISTYSHMIIGPVLNLMIDMALNDQRNDTKNVSAFTNFLHLKERIGRERALGIKGLLSHSFGNSEFIENFRFLISEQASYEKIFVTLANDDQKSCYNRYMNDFSVIRMEEMHQLLENDESEENIDISTVDWLELSTQKIDLMHKVEIELIDTLVRNNEGDGSLNPNRSNHSSINKIQKDFIFTLPLFNGLAEQTSHEILQNATLRNFKKGNHLFLEGEFSNSLFIILEGWVKLYKGNSSGDETIVQMLTSGDMVAESAVFLNAPYPINAQTAKSAKVLVIPAKIIKKLLRTNNNLALNILNGMSVHSHMLIQGIEAVRLKSATERVGWFLLKQLLGQDRLTDIVELPYDKSLIASYLDMKPETFSRTLKKFKARGFEINKNTIILPEVNALCGFCDTDAAAMCTKHGTPDCPNPDCVPDDLLSRVF